MAKQKKYDIEEYTYAEALKRVFAAHEEKREEYGDSWKEWEDYELLARIKSKMRKLEQDVFCKQQPMIRKHAVDLVNYTLFLLQNAVDGDWRECEDEEGEEEKPKRPRKKKQSKAKRTVKKKTDVKKEAPKKRGRPKKVDAEEKKNGNMEKLRKMVESEEQKFSEGKLA